MKTLLMIPSLALGLGLAGNAIAEIPIEGTAEIMAPMEIMTHKKVSLAKTSEFYQGDFLVTAKASLKGLVQDDLYTGRGATEAAVHRWVTN